MLLKYLLIPLILRKVCCLAFGVLKGGNKKGEGWKKKRILVYGSGGALIKKSDSVGGFLCVCAFK